MKRTRSTRIFFNILFLTFVAGSCEAKSTLSFSRNEVTEKLKQGDIGFILGTDLPMLDDLAKVDPSVPFYAGLLVEPAGDKLRAARLYEAALGSPVFKVKSEAARKLIPLLAELRDKDQAARLLAFINKDKTSLVEFVTLKGAALYVLGRYKDVVSHFNSLNPKASGVLSEKGAIEFGSWDKSFSFLSAQMQQKPGSVDPRELRAFLFDSPVTISYRWAYEELLGNAHYVIPGAEKSAVAGRLAISGNAFADAVLHFTNVRRDQLSFFFRYPSLLGDLGRAYMNSGREAGFKLFTDWETAIRTGRNSPIEGTMLNAEEIRAVRYALLYYAGRIRRLQTKHEESRELFTRALALAPDAIQEDSCIWYIINSAYTEKPETVPALVKLYAGRWQNDDDFYNVLDRLACFLVGQKKWNDLADVYFAIRNGKDGSTIAKYAYLMGRAVSLGYVSGRNISPRDYFTVAYEKGETSFYYRALAASYLGRTVVPEQTQSRNTRVPQFPNGNEVEFYVKFFEYGTSSHAMPYLRENASRYSGGEMRAIAGTFAASGRYLESIQIIGINMRRDNYVMDKADLVLYYPKPFTELIEKHARANNLQPYVFYGLIRTE
ncbi:MAG: hypothetical protein LBH07_03990, partial [Treponema sp.]|nr:hypothetical protein [Treponema sp.]